MQDVRVSMTAHAPATAIQTFSKTIDSLLANHYLASPQTPFSRPAKSGYLLNTTARISTQASYPCSGE